MTSKSLRHVLVRVVLLYLVLALAWAFLVPPWQGPDEPGHYEYARLLADLRRPPRPKDANPALQAAIIRDLDRHDFWRLTRQERPSRLPLRFSDNPFLRRSGTQLRDERPLYYLIPALLFRWMPFSHHIPVARVYTVLLGALLVVVATIASQRTFPRSPLLGEGVPFLMATLPMPLFIHATMNSNVVADLLGGVFFVLAWSALRTERPDVKTWMGLAGTVLLGAWLKRTTLILAPLAIILAWMVPSSPLRRHSRAIGIIVAAFVLAYVLFPFAPERVAMWSEGPRSRPAVRAPYRGLDGSAAFWLADTSPRVRAYIAQNLWARDVFVTRGKRAEVQVHVRAVGDAPQVCLSLSDSNGQATRCTQADSRWKTLAVSRTIAADTTFVRVVLGIGPPHTPGPTGRVLADNFSLRVAGATRDFLRNGDAERPAWRLARVWNWLRGLARVGPTAVYRPTEDRIQHLPTRAAIALGILFTSFWGNFGWLQYPLPWAMYGLLAVVTLGSLVGAFRAVRRCHEGTRCRVLRFNAWAFSLAVLTNWVLAWEPGWYPQGRYLFPLLMPTLALGLEGLRQWFPPTVSEERILRWVRVLALAFSLFALGYYLGRIQG